MKIVGSAFFLGEAPDRVVPLLPLDPPRGILLFVTVQRTVQ
jgi:hypothetical protein